MDIREDIKKEMIEEFREEIRREVIEEFMQQGRREGRMENQQAVILNMLKQKMDTGLIAEVTGMSEEEVKKLKNGS